MNTELEAVGDQGDAMVAGYLAAAERIELEIGPLFGMCMDVGCNTGAGMQALAGRWPGSEWIGLEPVYPYAVMARERGFRVACSTLETYTGPTGFQFIFSRHSLEHVVDRATAIRNMRSLLAPGGYLYVQAPIEPGGSPNALHVSPFHSLDEFRGAFREFFEVYWGPQETVAELILQKAV